MTSHPTLKYTVRVEVISRVFCIQINKHAVSCFTADMKKNAKGKKKEAAENVSTILFYILINKRCDKRPEHYYLNNLQG